MIPESTLYQISGAAMALVTAVFLGWLVRTRSGRRRRYLAAIPLVCATLALAYVGMSLEVLRVDSLDGTAMPVSRFVDYLIAWPIMVLIAGLVAGASRRQIAATSLVLMGTLLSTVLAWYLTAPAAYAAFGGAIVGYLVTAYSLLGPMAARSHRRSGEREVLYAKLRNLLLLLWGCYLVLGIVSRQGLGVLDAFTGVFLASYLDVIIRIGFGAILFRSTDAVDHVVAALESGGSVDDEQAERPADAVAD